MRTLVFLWMPLIILVGIIIVFFWNKSHTINEADRYETVRIERTTLSQTVTATGTVEAEKSLQLSFPFSGRIDSIFVKEGEKVHVGDPIIQLENHDQFFSVRAAESVFDLSLANLNLKLSPVSSEVKIVAEKKVEKAEAGKRTAENELALAKEDFGALTLSLEETVKNASLLLESAKDSLELSQIDEKNILDQYENDLHHAYEDALTEMKGDFSVLVSVLSHMDDILGVRDDKANDAIELYLFSKDRTLYLDAQESLLEAYQMYDSALVKFDSLSSKDTSQIETLLLEMKSLLEKMSDTLSLTREVLNKAVVGGNLTETKLSSLRAEIDADRTTITTKIQSLDTRSQTIISAKIDGKALVDSAHAKVVDAENTVALRTQALEQAKRDQERELLQGKGKIESAKDALRLRETDLSLAKADLSQILSVPREVELASLRAEVENARVKFEEAKKNLEKTILRAPLDGVVTDFPREVGEEVSSQTIVADFLSSGAFLVRANISEADIPLVSLDDEVYFTLDAYGDDVPFSGKIISLASGPTLLQDVVYYQIEATLLNNGKEVKPSMTANITIYTEKKENVFVVPSRAIQFRERKNFVRILRDDAVLETEVVLGLKGDDGLTEILSGISEGDDIIVFDQEERTSKF